MEETTYKDIGNQEFNFNLPTCGLFLIGKPDTIVEVELKHYDANCKEGGLMAVETETIYSISFLLSENN